MKKEVCVVIPVYRAPSEAEKASLKQCLKVLGAYDVFLITPKSLDTSVYQEIYAEEGCEFRVKTFSPRHFSSVRDYSKFCLNPLLYKAFSSYRFMFLYQLDGWVFRDEILEWCAKDYDFIGAPWFEGYDNPAENASMIEFSGNGGVSLRKISSFIRLLTPYRGQKRLYTVLKILSCGLLRRFYKTPFEKLMEVEFEDKIISNQLRERGLAVAPAEVAMYFAFEALPERLFQATGEKLPFACHGFLKYGKGFYEKFIAL